MSCISYSYTSLSIDRSSKKYLLIGELFNVTTFSIQLLIKGGYLCTVDAFIEVKAHFVCSIEVRYCGASVAIKQK